MARRERDDGVGVVPARVPRVQCRRARRGRRCARGGPPWGRRWLDEATTGSGRRGGRTRCLIYFSVAGRLALPHVRFLFKKCILFYV